MDNIWISLAKPDVLGFYFPCFIFEHTMLDVKLKPLLNQMKYTAHFRERMTHEGMHANEIRLNGKLYLNFCSNDYLGLSQHPAVKAACIAGVQQYGVGAGASPLVVGYTKAHEAFENALATFFNKPRALVFNSGYAANLSIYAVLSEIGDHFFLDRFNHASLLAGAQQSSRTFRRYPHLNTGVLAKWLSAQPKGNSVVITEGIFSMEGTCAPFSDLKTLCTQHDATWMVDDAHGIGVTGPEGRGSVYEAGVAERVDILMGTCGKSLGGMGAFIVGSETLIDALVNLARPYIYSTLQPACLAVANLAALECLQKEEGRRKHLRELIAYFQQLAREHQINVLPSHTPIQGIVVKENQKALNLSAALKQSGILVLAIRPPTVPVNTARLRITLTALHQKSEIERLFECLVRCRNEGLF